MMQLKKHSSWTLANWAWDLELPTPSETTQYREDVSPVFKKMAHAIVNLTHCLTSSWCQPLRNDRTH
ncbi:hypothetical protein SAMN05216285_1518 [Natrinema salifodinae]|uniref:Uncharacterized protein n=1 Tax=Natrinema salifodinae TaxID=1202768 RepID=A0A1I0NB27_9EURY|nr:hypothetical protein SAMN05216285_1518 [Natrinema salifodinae]